jgi:hypothetical protein
MQATLLESFASSVSTTAVVAVAAAPLLIEIVPLGGDVSSVMLALNILDILLVLSLKRT